MKKFTKGLRLRMRVLFWSEGFLPHMGGVEIFAKHLIQGLTKRGFEFSVITSRTNGAAEEEDWEGIKIYRLPLRPGLNGNPQAFQISLKKIAEIKKHFKPNLSHLNTTGPSFVYHLQTLNVQSHPSIFTFHFYPPAPASNTLLTKMLKNAHWITAVAEGPLQAAREYAPSIIPKSSFIYNALDFPPLSPEPLPWNPPVLLSIGRLVRDKGFDLALVAMAKLKNKFPELKMSLIGTGPEEENLKLLAKKLELEDRIEFLGHLSKEKLYQTINKSTLQIVPSRHLECFGLVALEAMHLSRPVIGAQSGGLPEVIINEVTGLVVPQNDAPALTNAIDRVLSNIDLAKAMGQAGRQWSMKSFNIDNMVDQYEMLFFKTVQEPF